MMNGNAARGAGVPERVDADVIFGAMKIYTIEGKYNGIMGCFR